MPNLPKGRLGPTTEPDHLELSRGGVGQARGALTDPDMITTPAPPTGSPTQRYLDQVSALRQLTDEEFGQFDAATLPPILVPVRVLFVSVDELSTSVVP